MKLHILMTLPQLAQTVTARIISQLQRKPESLLCLAGGETLLPIFKALTAAARDGRADFSRCAFVSLDEWVGLGRDDYGSCLQTLSDNLFLPLALRDEQICFFNGQAEDLAMECRRLGEAIVRRGGLDMAIAGVGMNGHVGFNEPGADPQAECHVVPLDEVTQRIAAKYFTRPQRITHGITLGIGALRQAREIALVISGRHKAAVAQRLATTSPDARFPASLLRDLPQTSLWLDSAAAARLSREEARL